MGSSLGSNQNLGAGKAECWGNYPHNSSKTHICLSCPWNHIQEKVFKAIILVSADVAGMFQKTASNFVSSSSVLFKQGWSWPPGNTLATSGCHNRGRGRVLLTSGGWKAGVLLNILPCTGRPPTQWPSPQRQQCWGWKALLSLLKIDILRNKVTCLENPDRKGRKYSFSLKKVSRM